VNTALDTFVKQEFPKLSNRSSTVGGQHDSDAMLAGRADGEKLRIHRGNISKGDQVHLLK